ncbi:MAG TPA: hypothetical protein PKB06_12880, partial [Actinotalea sp.]|nr:hypothetical protein [Actinotalea sp.]
GGGNVGRPRRVVGAAEGEAMALAVRRALFEEGRDVADPAVLAELSRAAGLDWDGATGALHDAVLADYHDGQDRGVVGSPHYFADTGDAFCPALDISQHDGVFSVVVDEAGMRRFLELCLG